MPESFSDSSIRRFGAGLPEGLSLYQPPASLTPGSLGLAEPPLVPFLFDGLLLPSSSVALPRDPASAYWVLIIAQAWDVFSPQASMMLIPITVVMTPGLMDPPDITPRL